MERTLSFSGTFGCEFNGIVDNFIETTVETEQIERFTCQENKLND